MKKDELNPADQTQSTTTPDQEPSRSGGGPTISVVQRELSDSDLGRVAGGPMVVNEVSTIADLADEDLRQVAGGPVVINE